MPDATTAPSSSRAVLVLDDIAKSYGDAHQRLEILRGAHLTLQPGEMVAMVAPSGTGKSTLLHIAGLLDRPDRGRVLIGGHGAENAPDRVRTQLRRHAIGFVYQFHHLIPEFTALENITLPQRIAGLSRVRAEVRARELLDLVGLADRAEHKPGALSGGEQQRVAIVRALANAPLLLLADEPTGNLDPQTADSVFSALRAIIRATGLSALIATHNLDMAAAMDRAVTLRGGLIVDSTS